MKKSERCPGSHTTQGLDWLPDIDYPGAAVCNYCSYGILVLKGSVSRNAKGYLQGTLRVHKTHEAYMKESK